MSEDRDTFLSRWSRRKSEARTGLPSADEPAAVQGDLGQASDTAPAVPPMDQSGSLSKDGATADKPLLTEEDFADVNFDALDYNSDYSRFMQDGVPESVRGKALQKLWLSDTVFTQVDPYQDYAGDYTDAATVPLGGVKTAYRVGRGFLNEAEAAEWEKLGKTPAEMVEIEARVMIAVQSETPDQAEILAMFAASEAYMGALYPAESNHFVGVEALLKPNVLFLVARRRGAAVGCGALVRAVDNSAEIKRMWVDPEARRERIGEKVLAQLEHVARDEGLSVLHLETGIHQPEAIALYRKFGFVDCGPFGDYQPDPLSVFMEKRLTAPAS